MHQLPRAVNLILPYDISCQKYTPRACTMIKSRFHEIGYSFAMWEDAEFPEKVCFDCLPFARLSSADVVRQPVETSLIPLHP